MARGLLPAPSIQLAAMNKLSDSQSIATNDTQLDKKSTVPKQMPSSVATQIPLATVNGVNRIACLLNTLNELPHRKHTNAGEARHHVHGNNWARRTPAATRRGGSCATD